MATYRAALGAHGEDIATDLLRARGYTIEGRNYHCRYGELDLICRHGSTVVFCEVKTRRSAIYGAPEEALTPRKLARLMLAAQTYLAAHDLEDADWRLDVVAIELDRRGAVSRTALYQAVGA